MKLSKTLATLAVASALSIAGLSAVTMAAGYERGPGNQTSWSGDSPHGKKMCKRGKHGGHGGHGKCCNKKAGHGAKGPGYLAKRLSVMETEIGIRAEQLDDWRDFTDALQATMKPPFMHPGGPANFAAGTTQEPFALAEGLANRMIERAEEAEKLKVAIAELKTTLTPEQLDKVKVIEDRLRARMAKHHGGKHRGDKHRKHGRGAPSASEAPQPAPDAGTDADAPYAPDTDDDA